MGMGDTRMMRSPTKERTPLVSPMRTKALGIQWPFCCLSHWYDTGVHWRMLATVAAIAQHCKALSSS